MKIKDIVSGKIKFDKDVFDVHIEYIKKKFNYKSVYFRIIKLFNDAIQ